MAARCPNCTRKIHVWNNHSGFCSKRCREESRSACLNCGKVGLYKHERLGCCSDECRFWYVTTLLGYDREFLLTPAWDKVVYHVRLPSSDAEISSLQVEELEFERAHETILVLAAAPWLSRQQVLAELPYQRFDNPAWQHLRADGTLSPEELDRFRRMCYDDPLLYQKLGEHVFDKIRGYGGTSPLTPATTMVLNTGAIPFVPMPQMTGAPYAPLQTAMLPDPGVQLPSLPLSLPQAGKTGVATAPAEFTAQVVALFQRRGYQVTTANGDSVNTLLLAKSGRQAIATYHWQQGMVGPEALQPFLQLMRNWEVSHGYFVTNGAFTLQAEDLIADQPIQLIDGDDLASLLKDGVGEEEATADTAAPRTADEDALPSLTTSLQGATMVLNGTGPLPESEDGANTLSLHAQTRVIETRADGGALPDE
jgi:hypothetical protein